MCHAISRFGRRLGPARHILPRSHVFSSSRPGAGIYQCDTRSQMKRWRFLFTTRLFIVFLAVFNYYYYFLYRKITILRSSDM